MPNKVRLARLETYNTGAEVLRAGNGDKARLRSRCMRDLMSKNQALKDLIEKKL